MENSGLPPPRTIRSIPCCLRSGSRNPNNFSENPGFFPKKPETCISLGAYQPTVGNYLREYEVEHKTVLPRRGTIHDMGPTLTHKKIIIEKLFIEQKSVQQVIRETCHSARAIERYITSFKQILLCYRKGMNIDEISFSVRKTKNLVQEYLDIIEIYKDRKYILDKLADYEVNVETVIGREVHSITH